MSFNHGYGLGGQQQTDPDDPRYSNFQYQGGASGAANSYYWYGGDLVIEDDDEPEQTPNDYLDRTRSSYPPSGNYPSNFSDTSGLSSSGFSSSANNTRGLSSVTSPDEEFDLIPAGQRCIFHWIDCKERRYDHDAWVEHIYYDHFGQLDYTGRWDFGRAPTSWTCGFRHCRHVVRNDDHQALWDEKLAHIYEHLTRDQGKPEDIQEDSTWMNYYKRRGLCLAYDVYGSAVAPRPLAPFVQGVTAMKKMPRKVKQLSRGHSQQDASGEPMHPVPNQGPTADVYTAPPLQYGYPQQEHQPYNYPPPMNMGTFPPPDPNQYHYGHPGPVGY